MMSELKTASITSFLKTLLFLGTLWTFVAPVYGSNYAPVIGMCEASTHSVLRLASTGLSQEEAAFVNVRRNVTVSSMQQWFSTLNISGFDAAGYIKSQSSNAANLPNIGIAMSGGGYRAMLTGAGVLKALDGRESTSSILGGLLQSSTYLTGLSGGSWLLSSVYFNKFSKITDLQSSNGNVWNLTTDFYKPVGSSSPLAYVKLLEGVLTDVSAKAAAGFTTTAVDFWGRLLSQRFFNAPDLGVNYTWSGLQNLDGFQTGQLPFPIVNAESRIGEQTSWTPGNTTVFEISPFEFGSWDPSIGSFGETRVMGSNYSDGLLSVQSCVTGYDQAGFIFGTSSALISATVASLISSAIPAAALQIAPQLQALIKQVAEDNGLVARYQPNPWYQFKTQDARGGGLENYQLELVDGGTDGETIPLQPLIQPARAVDIIIAADSGNDTIGFPNGTALIATAKHANSTLGKGVPFPPIPDANTFVNLGLNKRPTFFGCNSTDGSPLIVYLPNAPYTTQSNTSTFQFSYSYAARDALIANGGLVATFGNGSASAEFKVCMGCAILSRSLSRTKTSVPDACQQCFNSYCWNGTYASNTPSQPYSPSLIGATPAGLIGSSGSNSNSSSTSPSGTASSSSPSSTATATPGKNAGARTNMAAVLMLLPMVAVFMGSV